LDPTFSLGAERKKPTHHYDDDGCGQWSHFRQGYLRARKTVQSVSDHPQRSSPTVGVGW